MAKKDKSQSGKEYYEMLIAKKQYEEISKPFYKKIEYWKLFVTTILTFLTVLVMYKNGLFDFRSKELQLMNSSLELKKDNLEYDIKKFTTEKDSLIESHFRLVEQNKLLQLRNIQIEIANKKAFASLDHNGKLFVHIMQKNIELERQNQKLSDEQISNKINWLNYVPKEKQTLNSNFLLNQEKNKIGWTTVYENPLTIDLPNLPLSFNNFNSSTFSNSSNIMDLSKYINLGINTKSSSNLISSYKSINVIPNENVLYIYPTFTSENNILKSLNSSEIFINKNN